MCLNKLFPHALNEPCALTQLWDSAGLRWRSSGGTLSCRSAFLDSCSWCFSLCSRLGRCRSGTEVRSRWGSGTEHGREGRRVSEVCVWKSGDTAVTRKPPSYLFVWKTSDLVHVLLLDHERSQVGSVGGQKDDSEEGPHGYHDLTRGAFGVLHRYRVVKDQTPEQPDSLTDGEGWTVRLWKTGLKSAEL